MKTTTSSTPAPAPARAKSPRAALSRRLFLGGAGAAIALPAFESLVRPREASAGGASAVRRMLAYYVPCGIHMAGWTPATTGRDYTLSPILAPLGDLKSDVLVLTGLQNLPARPDGPGDHASGTGAFFTAAHPRKTEGTDIRNGISADQAAANAIGMATRFPSLQLGIDGGSSAGGCDSGYSCAYARNISWASATQPLPKLTNPRTVFDRLFEGFDPGATREQEARRRAYQTSVLDYARRDAQRLRLRLASTDQRKLDEYLAGVRELEQRVAMVMATRVCEPIARPPEGPEFTAHLRIMADIMALAFQCDLTRVITFMLGNAGSGRNYEFIGAAGGHHDLSHHQRDAEKLRKLQIIGTWEVTQFAYLLRKLKDAREPDGTSVLDNTTVFFSSEIEDGDSHAHTNMPILLAGKCGTAFDTGRHVRYATPQTVANLFIAMLHAVGAPVARFGDDGTRILENLGPISG